MSSQGGRKCLRLWKSHCDRAIPEFVSAVRRLQEVSLRNCVASRENAFACSRAFEYIAEIDLLNNLGSLSCQAHQQKHIRHIRNCSNCRKPFC